MATIKDVAKMAGVSTTTVSHVINKTRFVAAETEKLVLQAIQELNYSPSAVARSLKVNTTKSIGMIVTSSEAPYFAEIIHAVEEHCYRQGYSLFLCNTQNNVEKIKNHLEMLIKK
ncbi:DNA-binding transcriptional repressor PurR, partial [Pasteurella multocida subsp. multocida str. Anand1_buffalo]